MGLPTCTVLDMFAMWHCSMMTWSVVFHWCVFVPRGHRYGPLATHVNCRLDLIEIWSMGFYNQFDRPAIDFWSLKSLCGNPIFILGVPNLLVVRRNYLLRPQIIVGIPKIVLDPALLLGVSTLDYMAPKINVDVLRIAWEMQNSPARIYTLIMWFQQIN